MPVNHYVGRAVSSGFPACFCSQLGLLLVKGPWLVFGLHCLLIGGPLAPAQPSLDTGVRPLLGNGSIWVVSTLCPKLLRGPATEHPTAPSRESPEMKLGPRKPRPREEIPSQRDKEARMSHGCTPWTLCSGSKHLGPDFASCSEVLSSSQCPHLPLPICLHRR